MLLPKYPAIRYLLYLLTTQKYDVGSALFRCEDLGVPSPLESAQASRFEEALARCVAHMAIPSSFDPTRKPLSKATRSFLQRWRVLSLWENPEVHQKLLKFLRQTDARRSVEVMLLGPAAYEDIIDLVRDRYGVYLELRTLRAFQHYFWNKSMMTKEDWTNYFYQSFKYPPRDYLTCVSAPSTPAGAGIVHHIAGGSTTMDIGQMHEVARHQMFKLFMEHTSDGKPDIRRTQGAFIALQGFILADEHFQIHAGGSTEMRSAMDRIESRYSSDKPISYGRLTSGDVEDAVLVVDRVQSKEDLRKEAESDAD